MINIQSRFLLFSLLILLLISCQNIAENDNRRCKDFTLEDFYKPSHRLQFISDSIYNNLSQIERIAQMIIVPMGEKDYDNVESFNLLSNGHAAGVIFFSQKWEDINQQIIKFESIRRNKNLSPLLFSIDGEMNFICSRLKLKGWKRKKAGALKNINEANDQAEKISILLNALGFNINFAPVSDNAINKSVIGKRSFSKDEEIIKSFTNEFIKTTQSFQIAATSKHFPGHGYCIGDSHSDLVYIDGKLKELPVFKSNIENGVLCMMVGHMAIRNNINYNTNNTPSSLSKNIVTELLKNELDFKGIIITDALNMGALEDFDNAAMKAFEAGNDILLMPKHPQAVINELYKTSKHNHNYQKRIEESAKKIIRMKICLGLYNSVIQEPQFSSYKGKISNYPINVNLMSNQNTISGNYRYANNGVKLNLIGRMIKGEFSLLESNKSSIISGLFQGRIDDNSNFCGIWFGIKQNSIEDFQFCLEKTD